MSGLGKSTTEFLLDKFRSSAGMNAALAQLRKSTGHGPEDIRLFSVHNIAPELMEKANQAAYPSVSIYCEKVSNTLKEKFRTFSGTARLTIELRNSEDRLEALDNTLRYTEVICGLLNGMRGEWIDGASYWGGYEVTYSPIRPGGKHFLQSAKITFEVDISQ